MMQSSSLWHPQDNFQIIPHFWRKPFVVDQHLMIGDRGENYSKTELLISGSTWSFVFTRSHPNKHALIILPYLHFVALKESAEGDIMGIVDASSLGFPPNPPCHETRRFIERFEIHLVKLRNIFILKNNKFYRSSSNFSLHFSREQR